jgi:hypothetical protein
VCELYFKSFNTVNGGKFGNRWASKNIWIILSSIFSAKFFMPLNRN